MAYLSSTDSGVLSHKGSCSNHGMFLHNHTIKKGCSHSNKSLVLNCTSMYNRTMTYLFQIRFKNWKLYDEVLHMLSIGLFLLCIQKTGESNLLTNCNIISNNSWQNFPTQIRFCYVHYGIVLYVSSSPNTDGVYITCLQERGILIILQQCEQHHSVL